MNGMTTLDFLEILKYAGFFIGFGAAALVWAVIALVTGTRRWHEKHHRDGLRIMCDHCMAANR